MEDGIQLIEQEQQGQHLCGPPLPANTFDQPIPKAANHKGTKYANTNSGFQYSDHKKSADKARSYGTLEPHRNENER